MKPSLEFVVVNQDFVRDRSEIFADREYVTTVHLITIVLSKDVIKLLLGDEPVSIGVHLSEGQRYLLQFVIFDHHLDELVFRQTDSFLDVPIDTMPVEISDIACQVHLQFFV